MWGLDEMWNVSPDAHLWLVALVIVLPFAAWIALICWVYLVLSAPLRLQQRAQLFLDLLESGIQEGHSPEQTIVAVSESGDPTIDARFLLLAEQIRNGKRLGDALPLVPGLLPRQVAATLQLGVPSANFAAILSACRKMLTSGPSRSLRVVNCAVVTLLLASPATFVVPPFLMRFMLPKFSEILKDFGGTLPPAMQFSVQYQTLILAAQILMLLGVCAVAMAYGGAPWFARPVERMLKPTTDRLACALPWQRRRLLRNFSAILAILLDADVPEAQAVQFAAASTDNGIFIRHGELVVQQLGQGVSLTEAINLLDDGGEFRWRLQNAVHGHSGFMTALTGWHEALDAKAFQQEQAASQIVTTALVIVNGAFVGLIAVGVFQALTSIIWEMALW